MTDHLQTTPRGFQQVWKQVANQSEAEATATFATIDYDPAGLSSTEDLPRVDHLMALGEVLGYGGNGEVIAARQASLHRTIAVKRPKKGAAMRERLRREAWVIGYLEHPNIPPVHFVGADAQQQLLVGLKRIEGETFTDRLARQRGLECLDENLDVFIQVCNAVGFAHARGVLHLDVKPDNIMTGHFGEVYLLDWGLAVAFGDNAVPELMRDVSSSRVRGTPAFLAPEMITNEQLGPATDVYLLGGLLHYIITGRAPNSGESAIEAMQSAYEPPPRVFGAEVPEPLADICRRALEPDPGDRYHDADMLKNAVLEYRRDRRALEAVASARIQLGRVARLTATSDSEPATVYQAYGAARQAIEEAARAESTEKARSLLQRVLEQVISWELDRKNLGGAELLLAELPQPNGELQERCEALRAADQSVAAELRALQWEIDPGVGKGPKVAIMSAMAATIAGLEVVPYVLGIPATAERVLIGYLIYILILAIMTVLARRLVLSTWVNRALISAIWLLSLFGLAMRLAAYAEVVDLNYALGFDLVAVFLMGSYVGINLDRRVAVCVPVYMIGCAVCLLQPHIAPVAFAVSHAVGLTAIAVALSYGEAAATE